MSKFRSEQEMLDLIIQTANEDDRVLAVMMLSLIHI